MKKRILLIIILLFFSIEVIIGGNLKLLRIEEPTGSSKGKNKVLINFEDLKKIMDTFNLQGITANIELIDRFGTIFAILGKIKKGEIKWSHKIVDGSYLHVKFKKSDFPMILDIVNQKSKKPGLIVRVIDTKKKLTRDQSDATKTHYVESGETLESWEISFVEFADLTASMRYPINVSPGEELGKSVSIIVENNGTIAAKGFNVELVLSSDNKIPVKPALYLENFSEDILLKDGREKVELLKSGEDITLNLEGSIKIPADTTPGKYYLGAVIDPENTIKELSEENNVCARFIMINFPAPKRLILDLAETQLIYEPASFGLRIQCNDIILSEGKDWRKCRIRPYIHQIKHVGWKDFHWEVDTIDRSVWQIKGAQFCKKGGTSKEVKIKVDIKGGSKTVPPSRFILRLSNTTLEYEPKKGKLKLLSYQNQIAYTPFWKVFKVKSHLYHFRHSLWEDYFLEIDTFKRRVRRITGGIFGEEGGTPSPLVINLTIEK